MSLLQISLRQGVKLQLWFSCRCLEIEVRRLQPKNLPQIPPKKTSQKKRPLHHREYVGFLEPTEPSGLHTLLDVKSFPFFYRWRKLGLKKAHGFRTALPGS